MSELAGFLSRLVLALPFLAGGLAIEALRHRTLPSSVRLNLWLTVLFLAADTILGVTVTVLAVYVVSQVPGAGLWRLPLGPDPAWYTLAAYAFLWLCAADLTYYWYHRAQHRFGWLWAIHEVHHADESVNVTTARRHHWLETVLVPIAVVAPIAYVLAPPPLLSGTIALLANLIVFTSHLDVPITLGRWGWLVVTPQGHRLHHSIDPAHHDRNFAMICPVWDVLFGTYIAPTTAPIRTGLTDVHLTTVRAASAHPFRRWSH